MQVSCLVMFNCLRLYGLQPTRLLHPRQEYWGGLPFLPPEDLPAPGIEPASPALAGEFFTSVLPEKPCILDSQQQSLHIGLQMHHPMISLLQDPIGLLLLKMKVTQLCPTLWDPMDYAVHGILQARILSRQLFHSPGDLPNSGIKPRSPTLQLDSLPAEPHGKPKNTGVGSLSLLQWIFATQESNQGLLHCRWILYQLRLPGQPLLLLRLVQS